MRIKIDNDVLMSFFHSFFGGIFGGIVVAFILKQELPKRTGMDYLILLLFILIVGAVDLLLAGWANGRRGKSKK
jgi:hypothetical protein